MTKTYPQDIHSKWRALQCAMESEGIRLGLLVDGIMEIEMAEDQTEPTLPRVEGHLSELERASDQMENLVLGLLAHVRGEEETRTDKADLAAAQAQAHGMADIHIPVSHASKDGYIGRLIRLEAQHRSIVGELEELSQFV